MSHTFAQRKATAAAHKTVFSTTSSAVGAIVTADMFFWKGQSNAIGNTVNTTEVVTCTPANIAMSIMRENPLSRWAIDPLKNGNSAAAHIAGSSPAPAFAQRWFDLTGRRSLVCNIPASGRGLLDPSSGLPHWAPTPHATSLVGGYEVVAGYPRDQIIQDACDTQDLHPTYARGLRIGVWCGGEADADRLALGQISGADWETGFHALIDHMKATWALDYMLVYGIGRLGTTSGEVDANETASRAAIRAAQIAVCNSRADTFLILNAAKEKGTVFNTLTLDGNGDWSNGWVYNLDGLHYTEKSWWAMGHTGARNAAILLGLASGSLIGV